MKRTAILMAALAALPMSVAAQSAIDAYNLSQTDQRGTARFMAMGGAFTALGGDLSTLNQNPAGIGVYRRSEIGATLDISPRSFETRTATHTQSMDKTKTYCNNFGYVGTVHLDGAMRTFSWGASYNRVASFDRTYKSYNGATGTSISNYIASFTNGTSADILEFDTGYNPYYNYEDNPDWLSILAYNSYAINPASGVNKYQGLFGNSTYGDAFSRVQERGYIDEYAIDFGGNISDVVYWGIGFGITDLSYHSTVYYSESMADANICNANGNPVVGDAGIDLTNYRAISGSGWNFKAGLILKPIQEFRLGFAVHTPTWYKLSQSSYAEMDFSYFDPNLPEDRYNPYSGNEYTEDSYYDFRLYTPWKFMVGAAAVLGKFAIVSFDYEYQAFNDMSIKYQDGWGDFVTDDLVKQDIKDYFKAANIIRLGAEVRLSSHLSARAGYNHSTTNVKDEADNGNLYIYTQGMDPSYTFNKESNAYSFGLGYRYQAFYFDATYIYRKNKSTWHAFSDFDGYRAPTAELTETNNNVVLSMGFKF